MTNESSKESTGCCGGPAPIEVNACCAEDASAKAAGEQGCGCHDNGNNDKQLETRTACC